MPNRAVQLRNKVAALGIGFVLAALVAESVLQIYNPFPAVVRGNKIVLRSHAKTVYRQEATPKLQRDILVTTNSLGFRGDPLPLAPQELVKIITVGGSTTHCLFNSDNLTWPTQLATRLSRIYKNIWVNNAGLSGHSTFGHIVLMEDHVTRLHPEVVIFLVGLNDIGRSSAEQLNESPNKEGDFSRKLKSLLYRSELVGVIVNFSRVISAKRSNLGHHVEFRLEDQGTIVSDAVKESAEMVRHNFSVNRFRDRMLTLIEICRKNNIRPVFLTQPVLYGTGRDPSTNLDLSTIKIGKFNGVFMWKLVEKYNDTTRRVCKEKGVFLIDMAHRMPKDSRYYFDTVHYSDTGCEKFAEIVFKELYPYLTNEFDHRLQKFNAASASYNY